MEEEGRFKMELPSYMVTIDGENKTKEEKDELWQDLINQSEHKLIFVDCYVAWCGACEVEVISLSLSIPSFDWSLAYYISPSRCHNT